VSKAHRVFQVARVIPEFKAVRACQGPRVPVEHKDLKAQTVPVEHKDLKAQTVPRARKDTKGHTAHKVAKVVGVLRV
jgi:hypothetical protein